jgi:hypothetical protein
MKVYVLCEMDYDSVTSVRVLSDKAIADKFGYALEAEIEDEVPERDAILYQASAVVEGWPDRKIVSISVAKHKHFILPGKVAYNGSTYHGSSYVSAEDAIAQLKKNLKKLIDSETFDRLPIRDAETAHPPASEGR